MKLLITVCARGGSKGIPGKNIRPIAGKPLIAYSIETAKKFGAKHKAVIGLSTDDPMIKSVAKNYGLDSEYNRPEVLATDTAGKIDVIKDLLEFEEARIKHEFDYVLDLDVTSPLRTLEDLEEAYGIIQSDGDALNIFSVNKAHRNPYFNMVEQKGDGYYGLVKEGTFKTRQSAPKVYDMNASFYFYRRSFFEKNQKSSITEKSLIYAMRHTCFDLDDPIDFDFMSYLVENNKLNFSL